MFPELNTNTIQSEKRRPQLAETSPNSYPFNAMIHVADFKNQILTPNELAKITNSSYTGQNEVQEKFQREKEQLHKDSLERVKTWGNTVLGKRMRRLNAIQKRDELAEEGRREIDASWKKVQEKEHTEALNRAQSIQDRQEPQMRDLFSRLNLGEIIRERNMQLDIKKRDLHNQQLYDEMYRRDAVKDFIKLTKRDQSRLIQAKNERLKLAQYQSNQSKDKLGYERAVKNDNYEFYLKVNENNKLEEAASIQMLRKQRKSLKDDFKSDLEKGIDEKQKLMHEQNIFDAKVDNENRAFTRVKDYITEKTKSIATEKLDSRTLAITKIAEKNKHENDITKNKRTLLLDKLLHAHDTDRSSTEISAEKHQIYDKEFKEYKNELEQYKKQQELEKSINEEKFHLTQRDNLMKYNENMVKILEEKAKKSRDTYNDIYNQISERVVTKKTNLLNERSKDLEMINKYDDKDSKFRDYALVMCEEWAKDGRDVRAFINALNEKKAKVKGIGANHLDTFSRLGF